MHPATIDLERTVLITYTDEADATCVARAVPRRITFGRGAWWLELTDVETGAYARIRMSKIMTFRRSPS